MTVREQSADEVRFVGSAITQAGTSAETGMLLIKQGSSPRFKKEASRRSDQVERAGSVSGSGLVTNSRRRNLKSYGPPSNSEYPAYSGSPAYASPGNSGYPAYSAPPTYGYQSRSPYSPYSGSGDGYPVTGERPSEYWSPGAEYGVEPAS
jgi:hypothetical protein